MAQITKPWGDFSTGAIPPDKVNDQMDTVYNEFNGGINSDNIENDSLTDNDMATAIKPVTRYKECFQDHTYSGLTMSYSGLEATIASGVAYVDGVRVTADSETHTCDTSSTTYLDLSSAGTWSWNSNANPAADATRLYTIVTDATEITPAPTDTRTLAPVNYTEIEADACTKVYAAVNTATVSNTTATAITCIDLGTVDVEVGDDLVYMAQAKVIANTAINVVGAMNIGGADEDIEVHQKVDATIENLKLDGAYAVTAANAALPMIFTFRTSTTSGTATASMRSITVVRHRR